MKLGDLIEISASTAMYSDAKFQNFIGPWTLIDLDNKRKFVIFLEKKRKRADVSFNPDRWVYKILTENGMCWIAQPGDYLSHVAVSS